MLIVDKALSATVFIWVTYFTGVRCDAGKQPIIQPFNFPPTIPNGQNTKFFCSVSQGSRPLNFQWKFNENLLSEIKDKHEITKLSDTSILNIISVGPEDSGNYTCIASNNYGSAQHSSVLTVNAPPIWADNPTNFNVALGDPLTIDCKAKGFPTPTITFQKLHENKSSLSDNSDAPGFTKVNESRWHSNSVIEGHRGRYLCQASNGIGQLVTKIMTVTIRVPARFDEKFTSLSVRKGESARLTCEAKGDQPLSISWKSQGVEFVKEGNGRYEIFETLTEKGLASELLLREVDRNDGGVYACRTENPYGSDERNIKVSVLEVPAPPLDVRTQEVWSRSVGVAWAEPYSGNSPITQYHIQYWKNYGSNHRLLEMVVPSSQPSALVKGLHPGTPYAVAVVAENSVGRSNPSDTVAFVTGEEEPSGAPVDVSVKPKGTSTLHVAWKVPPKDEWNGQLTVFYVGFKVRGTSQPYSFKTVDFAGPTANHEHLLTNLRTDTEYGVVVQAVNNAGGGPLSQEVVIRTLGGDLPAPPTPFVVDTTDHSIKIQWTVGKSKPSSVLGFIIHFKKESGSWQQLPVLPVSEHSYLLKDLEPVTNYQLYMTSSNEFGEGDPSTSLSVRTDATKTPVALAGNSGHLLPVFTDLSLIIPVAASIVAVLVVIIVACFWIKRVRRNTNSVLHADPYMNGTLRSEKGYGYLPPGNGQRYVDMEKARPLTQIEGTADTECLYPAPYATIPVRDETFMRKLQAANQEMKIFLPQNMKDRPLPNPGNNTLKKDPAVYDTPQ